MVVERIHLANNRQLVVITINTCIRWLYFVSAPDSTRSETAHLAIVSSISTIYAKVNSQL